LSTNRSTPLGAIISLIVLAALTWPLVAVGASPQEMGSVDLATQASLSIIGAAAGDRTALRVSGAGDVNGDGLSDVVVGASLADTFGTDSGAAYVLFGTGAAGSVPLAALGGSGFRIDGGVAAQNAGLVVAGAGDVNGDGLADVIVGAYPADQNGRQNSGSVWVVFGKRDLAVVHLATLGAGGFRIDGAVAGDGAGFSVAGAGDVNGDGLADVLLSARFATAHGAETGSAYVVFGKQSSANVDLLSLGGQGFRIDGEAAGDAAGYSVAGAGDVNLDGRADVVVGAVGADHGRDASGSAYVVFGRTATTTIDLGSLGGDGYRLDGATAGEQTGWAVGGTGDINNDGRPDIVIGARSARAGGLAISGSAYVVWGRPDTAGLDLGALGAGGFRIDGAAANDQAGWSVAGAGDFNGDRRPDVMVGAYAADNRSRSGAGSAYVVFGKSDTAPVQLASLGAKGVRFDGAHAGDEAGQSVAAVGDFSGDRRPDVVIGAPGADDGGSQAGAAYVVTGFGDPPPAPPPPPHVACVTSPTTDCDGDHYLYPVDCNDANAHINPGVVDIPRNKIDEDCDGKDSRYARLGSSVQANYKGSTKQSLTVFTSLVVRPAVAGSTIRITCSPTKHGCPFGSTTRTIKKSVRFSSFTKLVYKARLKPRTKLEIRVTKAKRIGDLVRYTTHSKGKKPTSIRRCLVPGEKKRSPCAKIPV
jgi:hypothetical protein